MSKERESNYMDALALLREVREFMGEYSQKMDNPRCADEMRSLYAKTDLVLQHKPLPDPWAWIVKPENLIYIAAHALAPELLDALHSLLTDYRLLHDVTCPGMPDPAVAARITRTQALLDKVYNAKL